MNPSDILTFSTYDRLIQPTIEKINSLTWASEENENVPFRTKELSKDITSKPKTENKHFNWPSRGKKSNIVQSIEKQKGSNLKKQLKTVKFQIKISGKLWGPSKLKQDVCQMTPKYRKEWQIHTDVY